MVPLDWGVLALYFILIAATGWFFSRKKQTSTDDYFLAGRRMPVWAVAISIIATSLSAASFVGVPQQSYLGNLTYLATNLGGLLAIAVVALVFIPAFYRENVTSIYELLGNRMGPRAKTAASAAFLLGRVFASGSRIYIAAIPVSLILFGDSGSAPPPSQLLIAAAVMTVVGIAYTLAGGLASVIWTEVIQTAILVGAVLVAVAVLWHKIPVSASEIIDSLKQGTTTQGSKLQIIDASLTFSKPFTLLSCIVAFTLLGLASYGTDHDMAQRMLTCKSAWKGGQSAILAILTSIPIIALFLVIGLLLWIFYTRPDLMGTAAPTYALSDSRQIFLTFILREMPPGVSGIMMAGLFSVGISSLCSALNAMSAALVKDFYSPWKPGRDPAHYVKVGRIAMVVWGLILGAFACVCVYWQSSSGASLIDFALGLMTFAYAGLLAVFMTALFTSRGNSTSAIAAIITGFLVVALLQDKVWAMWAAKIPLESEIHARRMDAAPRTLAEIKIAWPWHLCIASTISFLVCICGKRPSSAATPAARNDHSPERERSKQPEKTEVRTVNQTPSRITGETPAL